MRNKLIKIITISSLVLIVGLFSVILFSNDKTDDMALVAENTNFKKMDDNTLLRFDTSFDKEEEKKEATNEQDVIEVIADTKEEKVEETPIKDSKEIIEESKEEVKEEVKEEKVEETPSVTSLTEEREVISTVVGNLTGYGADCYGCSGVTSSGHNLNSSIYYEDSEFGTVRILAADPSFPFYSIIRVSNVPGMDSFLGIVLDRGGNVGYGRGTLFDLAYASESDPNLVPLTRNVTFELLRSGK